LAWDCSTTIRFAGQLHLKFEREMRVRAFDIRRIIVVLKGHGFSRADFRANIAGFSRRGMSLLQNSIETAKVSGHDFSRAGRATKSSWALAPAVLFSVICNSAAAKAGI